MEYFLCIVLFGIGLFAAVAKKNLVKIVIGVAVMDYAINLFFILLGYRQGGDIPIISKEAPGSTAAMVDPLAQAIVLVTIVVGLSMTILLAGIAIRLHEKYGTFDITQINKLKG